MLVETVVKKDERRVFFMFAGKQPREGEPRERLDPEQEKAEAILAKLAWEKKNGIELLNFHYDPYGGGLKPIREPAGQVVKRGFVKDILGNVMEVLPPQNMDPDVLEMRPIGAWTGEWI